MTSRKRTGFAEPEENIKHCQAIAARGQRAKERSRQTERKKKVK